MKGRHSQVIRFLPNINATPRTHWISQPSQSSYCWSERAQRASKWRSSAASGSLSRRPGNLQDKVCSIFSVFLSEDLVSTWYYFAISNHTIKSTCLSCHIESYTEVDVKGLSICETLNYKLMAKEVPNTILDRCTHLRSRHQAILVLDDYELARSYSESFPGMFRQDRCCHPDMISCMIYSTVLCAMVNNTSISLDK